MKSQGELSRISRWVFFRVVRTLHTLAGEEVQDLTIGMGVDQANAIQKIIVTTTPI